MPNACLPRRPVPRPVLRSFKVGRSFNAHPPSRLGGTTEDGKSEALKAEEGCLLALPAQLNA